MHKTDTQLSFSISPTIQDIPRQDWDCLFGADLIESYGLQKTLEEARLTDFSFRYLIGKRGSAYAAVFPFFIMDFSCDMLAPGALRKIILAAQRRFPRFLKMKVIFLGTLTAEEFYLGAAEDEKLETIIDGALAELKKFCQKERVRAVLFNNLSAKNHRLIEHLKKKRLIQMESLPTTSLEINADSLEDYIAKQLGHNTRKDLRRKLKKSAAQAQLTTEIREDVSDIINDIYKLYLNNFSDSDIRFEILTADFFKNICANMPSVAKYFITYDKGRMVAFNLFFTKDGCFLDKFIGLDYSVALKYHLYYTTFCHNLEWCIKNGIRFYQPGNTDYHPKLRLGAKLIPLYIYATSFNPLLDAFMRRICPFIAPKNLDPSLKNIQY